ncbi:MAG TPA: hypothetical protein VMX95_03015 [Thermodesulfobacteriota bacterium]|nr:hypothetical protein [Thermodesulfobacteriota bacterium]
MPGLQPDFDRPLEDRDRVALFDLNSMWPCQYRDGAALGRGLAQSVKRQGKMFHHRPNAQEGDGALMQT